MRVVPCLVAFLLALGCAPGADGPGSVKQALSGNSGALWFDLAARATVVPGTREQAGAGPTRVDVGADGRVVVSAPLDEALLVIDPADKSVRRVGFPGTPRSVDARADGALLVLDGSTQSGVLLPPGDGSRKILATPADRGRWTALRFAPDGAVVVETFGNRTRPYVEGGRASGPERGLPLALSNRQAFAVRVDDLTAEVRAAPWSPVLAAGERSDPAEPAAGVTTWRWRTRVHLGAVHVVGEERGGALVAITEELTSRQPLRVQRTAWRLLPDESVERLADLPPPSPVPPAREWALLPDGTLLLLRVDDAGARLLAWSRP